MATSCKLFLIVGNGTNDKEYNFVRADGVWTLRTGHIEPTADSFCVKGKIVEAAGYDTTALLESTAELEARKLGGRLKAMQRYIGILGFNAAMLQESTTSHTFHSIQETMMKRVIPIWATEGFKEGLQCVINCAIAVKSPAPISNRYVIAMGGELKGPQCVLYADEQIDALTIDEKEELATFVFQQEPSQRLPSEGVCNLLVPDDDATSEIIRLLGPDDDQVAARTNFRALAANQNNLVDAIDAAVNSEDFITNHLEGMRVKTATILE